MRPKGDHHRPSTGIGLPTSSKLAGADQARGSIPRPRVPLQGPFLREGTGWFIQAHADADFKERHDFALRSIGQLKNEMDALRADLREKSLELNDLESDENTLIGQLDQRAI